MMPTPDLRWPKSGEPQYCSVDQDVDGPPSELSGTPWSCWRCAAPPVAAARPAALGGALLVALAALDGPALADVPPDGVEPVTSLTEPATDSTLVPNHHASAMTTARAGT